MTIVSSACEPVTTDAECRFSVFLDLVGASYLRNPVFCFFCNDYFIYPKREIPSSCKNCARQYDDVGQFAIPDFILTPNQVYWDPKTKEIVNNMHPRPMGIVMINEEIHYKSRARMIKLKFQVNKFMDLRIPVFILRKHDISEKENWQCLFGLAYTFSEIPMKGWSTYQKYYHSKEFQENSCMNIS